MDESDILKISGEIDSILFDIEAMMDKVLENYSKNKFKAKALMLELSKAKEDAFFLKEDLNSTVFTQ